MGRDSLQMTQTSERHTDPCISAATVQNIYLECFIHFCVIYLRHRLIDDESILVGKPKAEETWVRRPKFHMSDMAGQIGTRPRLPNKCGRS